jgi:hypothetical protein
MRFAAEFTDAEMTQPPAPLWKLGTFAQLRKSANIILPRFENSQNVKMTHFHVFGIAKMRKCSGERLEA